MKSINKKLEKKYAFVKNGVVFKISNTNLENDSCAIELTRDNVYYFSVDGVEYYLDSFIEVGDVFDSDSGLFKKNVHSSNGEESIVTYGEYFENLCREEIEHKIFSMYHKTFEEFTEFMRKINFNTIPRYMYVCQIFGTDPELPDEFEQIFDVNGLNPILITRQFYNESKENSVKNAIFEDMCKKAEKYGYKITSPSSYEDITIKNKN